MTQDFGVLLMVFILGLLIGGICVYACMTVLQHKRKVKAQAIVADMVKKGAVQVNGVTARKLAIDAVNKYKKGRR